jgi:hypothetical protein
MAWTTYGKYWPNNPIEKMDLSSCPVKYRLLPNLFLVQDYITDQDKHSVIIH